MDEPKRTEAGTQKPPPLAESLPEEQSVRTVAKSTSLPVPRSHIGPLPSHPELDPHLRQANLLRIRGDIAGAIREIESAGEIVSSNAGALETLADLLFSAGRPDDALANYQKAATLGGSATVEAKIARILLKQQGSVGLSHDSDALYRVHGPITLVASALVPGLGLAMGGEAKIAGISFVGWVISFALIFVLPPSREAVESFSGHYVPSPSGSALLIILGLINLGFWVYSMIETARLSKAAEKDG